MKIGKKSDFGDAINICYFAAPLVAYLFTMVEILNFVQHFLDTLWSVNDGAAVDSLKTSAADFKSNKLLKYLELTAIFLSHPQVILKSSSSHPQVILKS